MDQLLLDAAFPQADPARWIETLHLAGAQGCMAYVWDPFIPGIWTPDYCHAVQAAGFGILPVYVSFTQPIGHARAVMAAYGWSSGPVMGDIEQGSWPSEAYYQAWCQDLRDHGYMPVTYGTGSTLDSYRRYGDKAFLAAYIQRNLQPIPALAGVSYDGWQYANSFQINGVEVDASVTSIPLIGGQEEPMILPLALKRATIMQAFDGGLNRDATEGELQGYTARMADDGSNWDVIVAEILASGEGEGNRKLIDQAKALASSGLPPHTHPVTATTGQPQGHP